jgi:hypothetical protein
MDTPRSPGPPGDGSPTSALTGKKPASSASSTKTGDGSDTIGAIEGPVWVAWREGTLTRGQGTGSVEPLHETTAHAGVR